MKKYWAIFKIQLHNSLAYPAEMLWRSMAIMLFMLVFTFLWRTTYNSASSTSLAGLSLRDTIWYLMLAETIELSRPRFARTIADAVKDGSIAYMLGKPYDFILYQLAASAGDSAFRILLNAFFGGTLVWLLVGPPPGLLGWLLAFLAMIGAWLINFCLTAMIGLLAFVTEDVAPFEWIYQKLIFILGGMLIPIDFYPHWLQTIARSLPFAYMMYGPSRIFISPDQTAFLSLVTQQFIWVIILGFSLTAAYHFGSRRIAINGG